MKKFTSSLSMLLCLFSLHSCASTKASYTPMHTIQTYPKPPEEVEHFVLKPQVTAMVIGYLNINGNSYASRKDVLKEAKKQAAALGADFILEENSGAEIVQYYSPGYTSISTENGFSSYSEGPSVSTEKLPWAVFSAWVYQPADTGIIADEQATIQRFHLHSDAEKAGLRLGDEILGIDGFDIRDPNLPQHMMEIKPGDLLIYTVRRNNIRYEFTVTALPPTL